MSDKKKKESKLKLQLKAPSGYSSKEEHVISLEQWEKICEILND